MSYQFQDPLVLKYLLTFNQKYNMPLQTNERLIDSYLRQYEIAHQNGVHNSLRNIFVPLFIVGFYGFVWSIAFPYLPFLGKYNGFVNWATFLIAFAGYFYYRLSPVLTYALILILFILSGTTVMLERVQLVPCCFTIQWLYLIVAFISLIVLVWAYKFEVKRPTFKQFFTFLYLYPIWMLYRVFKYFKINY